MFRLRAARCTDLDALCELARYLDSPNLPADRDFLRARLERSERAFADPGPPDAMREYQFALEDADQRVVGTCAILSKHGTEAMPHTFLRVGRECRHSESAGVRTEHVTLQLGVCTDGPSEIGALILLPAVRGAPGGPGKLLSWGRFAFVGRHPDAFEEQLLAEMRASLDPEGRNAFWEVFGKRFTGMTYDEADRRSAHDKQFILDLFPDTPFYASLLPPRVAAELGQVHRETLPAVRLLERAGFRWIGEIDPFDAGPFYGAATREVIPVRDTLACVVSFDELRMPDGDAARRCIVAAEGGAHGFRAVVSNAKRIGDKVALPKDACDRLGVEPGDPITTTPLPPSTRDAGGARG